MSFIADWLPAISALLSLFFYLFCPLSFNLSDALRVKQQGNVTEFQQKNNDSWKPRRHLNIAHIMNEDHCCGSVAHGHSS